MLFLEACWESTIFFCGLLFSEQQQGKEYTHGIGIMCPASELSASVSAAEESSSPAEWVPTWPEL